VKPATAKAILGAFEKVESDKELKSHERYVARAAVKSIKKALK
jgi:hypothetical protein